MDIIEYNRGVWNQESKNNCDWSIPVSADQIDQARDGNWDVILTPIKPVPKSWFGTLKGKHILGLASGGGQQMPILAASGATITSFDNSDEQLAKDFELAQKHNLPLTTIRGDMADLSVFEDEKFDLIFHPVSNCFVPDINKVWQECYRVLKPGGRLLSSFMNPYLYVFDHDKADETGKFEARFKLPYSNMDAHSKSRTIEKGEAAVFSHTLEQQIGGQIAVGFTIGGFYEDKWSDEATLLNLLMATSMATLAIK